MKKYDTATELTDLNPKKTRAEQLLKIREKLLLRQMELLDNKHTQLAARLQEAEKSLAQLTNANNPFLLVNSKASPSATTSTTDRSDLKSEHITSKDRCGPK